MGDGGSGSGTGRLGQELLAPCLAVVVDGDLGEVEGEVLWDVDDVRHVWCSPLNETGWKSSSNLSNRLLNCE